MVLDVEGKLPGPPPPFVILEKCVARLYFRPAGQIVCKKDGAIEGLDDYYEG